MIRRVLICWAGLVCLGLNSCGHDAGEETFPSRHITLVVPFSFGGGTDQFARVIEQAIKENDLLPVPFFVKNIDGAGATIGSREVKDSEPDGYTMLLLHEAIVTAKFSGVVDYGPEAFTPVIGTGEVGMVIAVHEDSDYRSLGDLMTAAKESPDELVWTANLGAPSHFAGLMLEKRLEGARFRYKQSGGGSKRFHEVKGGHAAVTAFSLEEFLRYREGSLRGVAFLGVERHPGAADVPTAVEQGFDVTHRNFFFWWVPKGTRADRTAYLANVIRTAIETEQVQTWMKEARIDPIILEGKDMHTAIESMKNGVAQVDQRDTVELPNMAYIVIAAIFVMAIAAGAQVWIGKQQTVPFETPLPPESEDEQPQWRLAIGVIGAAVIYVSLLSVEAVPFAVATSAFVLTSGLLLARAKLKVIPYVAALALVMGFGLQTLLTQFFEIDLP